MIWIYQNVFTIPYRSIDTLFRIYLHASFFPYPLLCLSPTPPFSLFSFISLFTALIQCFSNL